MRSNSTPVLMPRQGTTVETCVLVSWLKRRGDVVRRGEPLAQIETDKATMEIESPADGVLLEVHHEEGAEVPVLAEIAVIGQLGEGGGEREETVRAGTCDDEGVESAVESVEAPSKGAGERVVTGGAVAVSPRARKRAQLGGVDVALVRGTGPGGRVIERDVAAVEGGMEGRSFPGPVREVKLDPVRKRIRDRMVASLSQAAQLTLHASADATVLLGFRKRLNERREAAGLGRLSVNDLLLFAVSRVLRRFPVLNGHCLEDHVVEFDHVHLGMAVDTARGLMVPVIRFADLLSLEQLVAESSRLAKVCQGEGAQPEALRGGTFTVTNLGALGVEHFTPILNPPEIGILGVGSIQQRPSREGQGTVWVPHLLLSLTFDHRAVDGAPAARFLGRLGVVLGNLDLLVAGLLPEN
jgi:pyruvate dehydrogenase E2 component (dihydrolipoamide acetyltransferase)